MGALFMIRDDDPEFAAGALEKAAAEFALQGLGAAVARSLPGWRLLHAPAMFGGPDSVFEDGDDLIAVAGTLSYRGMMGRDALAALLAEAQFPAIDWSLVSGLFAALVHKNGRTFLFTDYFAAFRLFHDEDRRVFSTSMLATANILPRLSFDAQAVYEFAFNIAPIGDDTVIAELKRVGPGHVAELGRGGAVFHDIGKPLPETAVPMPLAERIARHRERLMTVVAGHVAWFGDRVHAPLSGGLDSRLLLAALRAQGCTPAVYVYGSASSPDVRIARQIGESQGFAVEWIDKSAFREIEPDQFTEQVARNFHESDGVPNYGGMFDNGGNEAARKALHVGGALAASGGCGEVYRDFFFLPDRPISARNVARSFFARYDRRDATAAFDESRFLTAIEDKILVALGRPDDRSRLPRLIVEQIYPRVRCRAFFGGEISMVGRLGPYLMPFLDQNVAAEAMTLPIEMKQAGTFEAALLNDIDPVLARQPSAYGHDFTAPPSRRHRLSEWSTRVRPAWVRHRSYEWRRRLGKVEDEHSDLLTPDYLGRVIDLEFPVMRRYFDITPATEPGLLQRLACLEYMAGRFGARFAA